jgi:hypothetical protein
MGRLAINCNLYEWDRKMGEEMERNIVLNRQALWKGITFIVIILAWCPYINNNVRQIDMIQRVVARLLKSEYSHQTRDTII